MYDTAGRSYPLTTYKELCDGDGDDSNSDMELVAIGEETEAGEETQPKTSYMYFKGWPNSKGSPSQRK